MTSALFPVNSLTTEVMTLSGDENKLSFSSQPTSGLSICTFVLAELENFRQEKGPQTFLLLVI